MALARVEQLNLGLSAGAVVVSYALATPLFAASLAAGAVLEAINLGAIHRGAKRLFDGKMMTNGWVGMLSLRLVILGFAIFFAMRLGAHPVALVIGLSITMPATIIDAWLNRPPIIDPAELPTFLEEFDEEDSFFSNDDNDPDGPTTTRVFPTGYLLTSRPLELEECVVEGVSNPAASPIAIEQTREDSSKSPNERTR